MNTELMIIVFGLFFIAMLYSSVGHGGASGYLAILSLTTYANEGSVWLKQHAWTLNLIVAGIAFFYYRKEGYHDIKLTLPFISTSIPFAVLGSYVYINGSVYDVLLSIFLILSAWKLLTIKKTEIFENVNIPDIKISLLIGSIIGLICGIVGIGGGILLTPIIIIKGWATPKGAAATSAIFIWLNSIAGLIGSTLSGQLVEFDNILSFSLVVLIGGIVGAKWGSKNISQKYIRSILSIVLIIAASKRMLELIII